MHSEYDENLRENAFFKEMLQNHSDILKKTAEEHWIICVPRSGTLESNEIDMNTILDHVLVPYDDGILRITQTCSTLSKKQVQIWRNQINIENQHFFSHTINILFKETFYEDKSKYTVWCIDRPLFVEHSVHISEIQVLESLPDCIDFLWSESMGQEVLQQIQNLCMKFIETTSNYEFEDLQTQKDLIGNLYSKCLQKSLKNNHMREKAMGEVQFLEKLKLAIETYMQYCLDVKIMFGISTFLVEHDTNLNKIIRRSQHVSGKILGISPDSGEILSNAMRELGKLNNSFTILDKVDCLDKTFNKLCGHHSKNLITSDDLLQMFVSLILKSDINNWISNLNFIKDFKFCTGNYTEHVNFLLTTLEAAIEYLKTCNFDTIRNLSFEHDKVNQLFNFVKLGELNSLKSLFENSQNENYRHKLCHPLCICEKCEEITKSLLFDKEIRNEKDRSLLIYATIYEQTEIVEYLLNNNLNVNSQDCYGKSALHYASEKGFQDIILLLISNDNVNVNIQDNNGDSPLHLATSTCYDNCVKALIYSSMNLDSNIHNSNRETPLHSASKLGYFNIVKILLENATSSLSDRELRSVLRNCHNCLIKNYIEEFSIKKVIPSFAYSCNIELKDNIYIETNFGIKPRTEDDLRKINLLISSIKNNDFPLTCFYLGFDHTNRIDLSPKCHPLCNCEKCKKLDDFDIFENIENDAIPSDNHREYRDKINVNMCNFDGYTPIHVASQFGRSNILRVLLDCGAQVNIQTYRNFFTPLHLACINQQIGIVKELVKCCNCDVNIRDFRGNTPLFYACSKNDSKIIDILLENDADCDLKNYKGHTVWDVCQRKMLYCAFKALKKNKYRSHSNLND